MASNPTNMTNFAQKKLCTSNHTCNQQVECKISPQVTLKSTQKSKTPGNFHFFKRHSNVNFKMKPQGTYDRF